MIMLNGRCCSTKKHILTGGHQTSGSTSSLDKRIALSGFFTFAGWPELAPLVLIYLGERRTPGCKSSKTDIVGKLPADTLLSPEASTTRTSATYITGTYYCGPR